MFKTTNFFFVLCLFTLFTTGSARADTWSGEFFTSNWFSVLGWENFDGPPGATETAFFPAANPIDSLLPVATTDVELSASTTIRILAVSSPLGDQYTFTGSNGAILTGTEHIQFQNEDFQPLNVHTVTTLGLNTPSLDIFNNAVLSLNDSVVTTNNVYIDLIGRVEVNEDAVVSTNGYQFVSVGGEIRVNSGGELRVAADTFINRGLVTINAGGELNALPGVDLEYNSLAQLKLFSGHSVDDGVHLKATGGGDIISTSYIDVGNGRVGTLTVTGSGSILTAGGSISDWGAGTSGNATVTISDSAVATVSSLRAGTSHGRFLGSVAGGATLRTTGSFTMGGDATVRTVALDVNGGTLETNGLATFNNRADLNLVNGTVNFKAGATFNSGSRIDWTGGNLILGSGTTLLVDNGFVNRTIISGFSFGDNTTIRIRNSGGFVTPSYFDLGNATLDMNNGGLTVGTTGGSISDWGGSGATTTATIANNAVATYNSGLRMGLLGSGGTTNATISGGARLVANGSLVTGGVAASNVTLNVTGGRVESNGTISLQRGTTTTVSSAGAIDGQDITLGSAGGTTTTTVTGANSLLKVQNTLRAGLEGTSTLTVSAGGMAESLGATILGELSGALGTVTVTGSNSRLRVGASLTVGAAGTGVLNLNNFGFATVVGGVTVSGSSRIDLDGSGALEITPGQSITNNGEIELTNQSDIRADVLNASVLRMHNNSSVSRNVTLQGGSQMFTDNSSVGSLTQQAGSDLYFDLRGLSDFDNLTVTGAASLNGDIVVSLFGGFVPTLGTEFQVLTAGSLSGLPSFDFSAAPLASGLSWATVQLPTSLSLRVVPSGTAGDFDVDGDVDGNDFLVWQRNLSVGDLVDWRANFGTSGSNVAATAVPEPTTAWLLFVALVGSAFRNRRNGSVARSARTAIAYIRADCRVCTKSAGGKTRLGKAYH